MSGENGTLSRRRAVQVLALMGFGGPAAATLLAQSRRQITPEMLATAENLLDQDFTPERLDVIATALQRNLDQFQIVRDLEIDDLIEPAPMFVAGWR